MLFNKFRLFRPIINKYNNGVLIKAVHQFNFNSEFRSIRVYSKFIEDDENEAPRIQKSFKITDQRLDNRINFFKSFEGKNRKRRRPQKNSNESYTDELIRLDPIEWSSDDLENIETNFYRPSEITINRTADVISDFRTKHNINLKGSAPAPIFTFNELRDLPEPLMNVIKKQKFSQCTPIQAQGLPIALSGKNIVGIAQTGSGKTLAFIIPAIIHILHRKLTLKNEGNPIALVLAPTRELAQQIQQVVTEFGAPSNIRSLCLCGGVAKVFQLADINKGCDIIIGTPGRLIDLLDDESVNLSQCSYVVFDEADHMLELGFEQQVRQIISQIRPNKQLLMWSATWPLEIRDMAVDFMAQKEFVHMTIGSTELCVAHNIKQNIIVCEEEDKPVRLLDILDSINALDANERKTLIFTRTRRNVNELAINLKSRGYKVDAIHGGLYQIERDRILADFRKGNIQILVATSVASRGLHVDNIKHVINYNFPNSIHEYIHRIGRTGRVNSNGSSYTLFTEDDFASANQLVEILRETDQEIPSELFQIAKIRVTNSNKRDPKRVVNL